MCYYNNRFIDASTCSNAPQRKVNNIKCNQSCQDYASFSLDMFPQSLPPQSEANLLSQSVIGDSIDLAENGTDIALGVGAYLITYSATLSAQTSGNFEIGFNDSFSTINGSTTKTFLNSSQQVAVSRTFIYRVQSGIQFISLTNLSTNDVIIDNLNITVTKIHN